MLFLGLMILSNSVPHFSLNLQIGNLGRDGCSPLTVVVQGRVERRPKDHRLYPGLFPPSKSASRPIPPGTTLSSSQTHSQLPGSGEVIGALKCSTTGRTGISEDWTGACLASFAPSSGWSHSSRPGWIPLTVLRAPGEGSRWAPGATDFQTQA